MLGAVPGSDWSEAEIALCVDAYFEHLKQELSGSDFNKLALYRHLATAAGRTPKSIERKFQNISAVLDVLGREWIRGLAPLRHYQELLANKVSERIGELDALPILPVANVREFGFAEVATPVFEAPPARQPQEHQLPEFILKLAKLFDPVARDLRNKAIGDAGEEVIFQYERQRLRHAGRSDLSSRVRWASKEDGDGLGYDILSYTESGEKSFIEVKTTVGGSRTPFFVSRNEYEFCSHNIGNYKLVRLFDFRRQARAFELKGALDSHVNLSAEVFRADF